MKVLKQHRNDAEANKEFCDGCALGKAHRQSFGSRTSRARAVGEQIKTDVCGPMTETSVGGARYYACFKNDYSKYRGLFFITKRRCRTVYESFWKKWRLQDASQNFWVGQWKVIQLWSYTESARRIRSRAPTHLAIYSRTERCSRVRKSYNRGKRLLYASRQWIAERTVGWGL